MHSSKLPPRVFGYLVELSYLDPLKSFVPCLIVHGVLVPLSWIFSKGTVLGVALGFVPPDSFLSLSFQQPCRILQFHFLSILLICIFCRNVKKFNQVLKVVLDAGAGAVNFILDHAEVDFVFVQDKKVKEVRTQKTKKIHLLFDKMIDLTTLSQV